MPAPLAAFASGFRETIKKLLSKPVTIHYPDEYREVDEKFRGRIVLDMDLCIGCTLCAQACPNGTDCMSMVPGRQQDNNKRGIWPRIDVVKCMYCALCEEVCPTDAIYLTPEFRTARYDRAEFDYDSDTIAKTEAELAQEGHRKEGGVAR